jgi:hypothetical protein
MAQVIMTITCDWEGRTLNPADLKALQVLNTLLARLAGSDNPPLPITHFICPAYFTRTDTPVFRTTRAQQILESGAIKSNDEVGLHIHCWKSLALEGGIPYDQIQMQPIGAPPFDPDWTTRKDAPIGPDFGETVPLGIYSQQQIGLYLQAGITLLNQDLGFNPVSYRTGMWVTCDEIFNALSNTPLKYEASALPYDFAATLYAYNNNLQPPTDVPAFQWNAKIWGNAQTTNQDPAYVQNTLSFAKYNSGVTGTLNTQISQPQAIGTRIEIPDTGALIPSTNTAIMNLYIDRAINLAQANDATVYASIGLHQENASQPAFFNPTNYPLTARELVMRTNGLLDSVVHALTVAQRNNIPLYFRTVSQVGALLGG